MHDTEFICLKIHQRENRIPQNKQNRFLSVLYTNRKALSMTLKDDQLIKILWGCGSLEQSFELAPYSVSSRDLEALRLHERFKTRLLEMRN